MCARERTDGKSSQSHRLAQSRICCTVAERTRRAACPGLQSCRSGCPVSVCGLCDGCASNASEPCPCPVLASPRADVARGEGRLLARWRGGADLLFTAPCYNLSSYMSSRSCPLPSDQASMRGALGVSVCVCVTDHRFDISSSSHRRAARDCVAVSDEPTDLLLLDPAQRENACCLCEPIYT